MKLRLLLSVLLVCAFGLRAQSAYTNLVITGPGTNFVTIRSNQVAKVVTARMTESAVIRVKIDGKTFSYEGDRLAGTDTEPFYGTPGAPTVAGPAEIWLVDLGNFGPSFVTVEIRAVADQQFTPSNAVVIPADSGGPVEIVLESSADLTSWTAALPGVYGTSTTNRFFRVRAIRR